MVILMMTFYMKSFYLLHTMIIEWSLTINTTDSKNGTLSIEVVYPEESW